MWLISINKRGQVWYTDFIVGIIIFFVVVFVYYAYSNNTIVNNDEVLEETMLDAKAVASALISQGSPANWTSSNVQKIGITNGRNRINLTKLDQFLYNVTYIQARTTFETPYDFYFYFENSTGGVMNLGQNDTHGIEPEDYDNLVSIKRIVIYNSTLVNMVVQVWH